MVNTFVLTIIFSFFTTFFAVPFIIKLGLKFSIFDTPNERKQHNNFIVRIGGIALLLGVGLPILLFMKFNLLETHSEELIKTILVGSVAMFIIGFIDDIYSISFSKRLFSQLLVSSFIWNQGLKLEKIEINWLIPNLPGLEINPFLSYLITNLWVVGLINAFNWLDGLDGLAAGLSLITTASIFFAGIPLNIQAESIIMVALIGSSFGFLIHNFNPAKIFMGDCGSYLIGSLIAFYTLFLYKSDLAFDYGKINSLSMILFLFVPIVDMVYVVLKRILKGRLPFYPDREHLHHRILRIGFNHKESVIFCYLISLFFSFLALGNVYPNFRYQLILISLILNFIFLKLHFNKFMLITKKIFKYK